METVMVSDLPALGVDGHFYKAHDVAEILKYGYVDHEVYLDADGKAYAQYGGVLQPLFQFNLVGSWTPLGEGYADTVKPLLNFSPVEVPFSLHDTPYADHQLTRDNYYIHYKEDMWSGVSARRKRRIDGILNSKTRVVRLLNADMQQLYPLGLHAYRKFGTLEFLDFFSMAVNSVTRDFHSIALVDESDTILAVACFSRVDTHNDLPVFGFNQYFPVKEGNWASDLLVKAGYALAELYGDLLVDTCYTCAFNHEAIYEYKKLVSNLSLPVHSLLIKEKGVGDFTPPYIEVEV